MDAVASGACQLMSAAAAPPDFTHCSGQLQQADTHQAAATPLFAGGLSRHLCSADLLAHHYLTALDHADDHTKPKCALMHTTCSTAISAAVCLSSTPAANRRPPVPQLLQDSQGCKVHCLTTACLPSTATVITIRASAAALASGSHPRPS